MNRDIAAQFIKMLTNLDLCLAKAAAHAEAKQFNVENFFGDRLIVDMLPLSKQVLICCDSARTCVATASHGEQPVMGMSRRRWRIRAPISPRQSPFCRASWMPISASSRAVATSPLGGRQGDGWSYLRARVRHPQLLFPPHHDLCPAAPGRVDLGKRDYLGAIKLQ